MKLINCAMGGDGHAVSSFDLHEAIMPAVNRLKASDSNGTPGNADNGRWYATCELIAERANVKTDAVARRLYDVVALRSRTLNVGLADLAMDELGVDPLRVPVIPRTKKAAMESVEAYTEGQGFDQLRLARMLFNFARGYISTFEDAEASIAAHEAQAADADQVAA